MWRIPVPGDRVRYGDTTVTVCAHYRDDVQRRLVVSYGPDCKRSVPMAECVELNERDPEWVT